MTARDSASDLRYAFRRGIGWTAATRLAGVAIGVASNVLLARLVTPAELGGFVLVISAAITAMLAGQLGQQSAVVKLASEALAAGQPGRARGAIRASLAVAAVASAIATLVLLALALAIPAERRGLPLDTIALGAALVFPLGLAMIAAEAFRGLRDYRAASLLGGALYGPILVASYLAMYLSWGRGSLNAVLAACAISALASLAVTGLLLARRLGTLPGGVRIGREEPLRIGWPLMFGGLALFASTQADLWVLGAFRTREEVAQYAAAARIVSHVVVPMLIMSAVVAPLVAELRRSGRRDRLERLLHRAALIDLAPATVALVVAVVAGDAVLAAVFGEAYRGGRAVLAILAAGLVGAALAGPALTMLAMAGGQRAMMAICIASVAVQLVAGMLVVRPFGGIGVAAVAAAALVLQSAAAALWVRRQEGVWTSPLARLARGRRPHGGVSRV